MPGPEAELIEGFIVTETAPRMLTFGGGDPPRTYLTITEDGHIEIGPGLSEDEATQATAKLLVGLFRATALKEA